VQKIITQDLTSNLINFFPLIHQYQLQLSVNSTTSPPAPVYGNHTRPPIRHQRQLTAGRAGSRRAAGWSACLLAVTAPFG
jgi:hypothetical protein